MWGPLQAALCTVALPLTQPPSFGMPPYAKACVGAPWRAALGLSAVPVPVESSYCQLEGF